MDRVMMGVGLAAVSAAAGVALARMRFGRPRPPSPLEADVLLDRFMPVYDVAERQHLRVRAPAHITLATANEMDLTKPALVRVIFRARELAMRSRPVERAQPRELVPLLQSLGWGLLAESRGRELVFGAVTKPWEANVVFRAVPSEEFARFREPGVVKIAWTLRADPVDVSECVFRTETRAVATDETARAQFRRYWSFVSLGVVAIRWLLLWPLKTEAERRAKEKGSVT